MKRAKFLTVIAGLALAGCGSQVPLTVPQKHIYADTLRIAQPAHRATSLSIEIIDKTFDYQLKQALDIPRSVRKLSGNPRQALNANPFDEVENSVWFTNRNGAVPLSLDAIRKGPDRTGGPDTSGAWTVTSVKTEGVTPGLTILDATGRKFVVKFDPLHFPELASGTEVVGTKLFHAAGYNVPENYITWLRPTQLEISPNAKVKSAFDEDRPMTEEDLKFVLNKVNPDGKSLVRALASRYLPGIPVGPWPYLGTRSDDPNDLYPHEHRREVRGLYVIASWINHADMKEENTLDMYDPDRKIVTHYLIDFGASMGSSSTNPSNPRRGQANSFDLSHSFVRLITLGLYVFPYERAARKIPYPSVGYLENDLFNPGDWKPMYPVPAFENLTLRDAFWGTRIVTSFSDKQIEAAVDEGQFSDSAAAAYMVKFLVERRDRIGRYWLSRLNPIAEPQVSDSVLTWNDLGITLHYATGSTSYTTRVFSSDGALLSAHKPGTPSLILKPEYKMHDYVIVSLQPERDGLRCEPLLVYLKPVDSAWKILGLRRLD